MLSTDRVQTEHRFSIESRNHARFGTQRDRVQPKQHRGTLRLEGEFRSCPWRHQPCRLNADDDENHHGRFGGHLATRYTSFGGWALVARKRLVSELSLRASPQRCRTVPQIDAVDLPWWQVKEKNKRSNARAAGKARHVCSDSLRPSQWMRGAVLLRVATGLVMAPNLPTPLLPLLLLLLPPAVEARWRTYVNFDSATFHNLGSVVLPEDAVLPDDCKTACEAADDCHGFVYSRVLSTSGCYFRSEDPAVLLRDRHEATGSTLFVMTTTPAADEATFWLYVVIAACILTGLILLGAVLYCVLSRRRPQTSGLGEMRFSRPATATRRQSFVNKATSPINSPLKTELV